MYNANAPDAYARLQDYFIISSEKLKTWLNMYHITVNNNTYCILKNKQKKLKEQL